MSYQENINNLACEADGLYSSDVHKKNMNLAYEAHGLYSSYVNKKILTI